MENMYKRTATYLRDSHLKPEVTRAEEILLLDTKDDDEIA